MLRYLKILLLFLLPAWVAAQSYQRPARLDSLLSSYKQPLTDSLSLQLLPAIVDAYKYYNPDSAQYYAEQMLELAQANQSQAVTVLARYKLGQVAIIKGRMQESLANYKKGYELAVEWHLPELIDDGRYYQATVYESIGEYQQALNLHLANLREAEQAKDTFLLAQTSWEVGENYRLQQDGPTAEKYFRQALELYTRLGDRRGAYKSEYHVALGRDLQGHIAEATQVLAGLFKYHDILNSYDSANIYNDLGRGLIDIGEYDSAETVLLKALQIRQKLFDLSRTAGTLNELATLHLRQGNYAKVLEYDLQALPLAEESGNIYKLIDITDKLNQAYYGLGKYKEAYDYLQKYQQYTDSLFNEQKARAVANVQTRYETEKKEQENQLLKQEKQLALATIRRQNFLTISSIVGLILVSVIAFIAWRAYRIKQQAVQEINRLHQAQNKWFNNIAHELRTPLTLILAPLNTLLDKYQADLPARAVKELEVANKNSKHLLRLVNQILDVSKMDAGELTLEAIPSHIPTLVKQTVAFFTSLAEYKNITLQVNITNDFWAEVDAEKIQNILINLLANALKFTPPGGKVEIGLRQKDDHILLTVHDNGPGIPPEDLPHIFERFYQVQDADHTQQGGSGIGLALAREFARLHNGRLTAQSESGQGSTFTLELPANLICEPPATQAVEDSAEDKEPAAPQPALAIRSSEKPNILLVEDNPDMQAYIEDNLREAYHVVKAKDGQEALEILQKFTPDLILSDVMMPRLDGLQLARKLKENRKYKSIPFLTLTARIDEETKFDALRIGIDDYMVKPFNTEELLTRIANLIDNYRARKEAIREGLHPDDDLALSQEEEWVNKLKERVLQDITNNKLSVKDLSDFSSMSESTLHRLLKKTTGLTPGQFIREIRLQKALELLELKKYNTVAEVVYAVGFENQSYFGKLFKKRFGKSIRDYLTS